MAKSQNKENIMGKLQELEGIVQWFQKQEDLDLEAGLEKVKAGAVLVKELKSRLKKIENEFKEVKDELEGDA